jgi:hypothetical protein
MSRAVPGTLAFIHVCAGAGRRGGQRRRSEVERPREWEPSDLEGFSKCCAHSRENLKENARCEDAVAGGVSESVEEVLL